MSVSTWYMYVLHCHDKSYYCGITTNPTRRVKEHNNNKKKASKYAWSRRPVVLFYKENHNSRGEAQKAECAFKKLNKSQKLDYMFKRCKENTLKASINK
jgi:putative endonuclease